MTKGILKRLVEEGRSDIIVIEFHFDAPAIPHTLVSCTELHVRCKYPPAAKAAADPLHTPGHPAARRPALGFIDQRQRNSHPFFHICLPLLPPRAMPLVSGAVSSTLYFLPDPHIDWAVEDS